MNHIVIGIDPGINTGMALYVDGELVDLNTVQPWQVRIELEANKPAMVVFEDSRKQSHTWTRSASREASLKMARNVGEIDAWCKLIEAECEVFDIPCMGISPLGKGAKLAAPAFARVTGWTGKSNEHTRDAAMVAWPHRNNPPK